MLKKEKQREYFRERWDSIIVHFDRFAKRTNANDLHKVRVELKKIRALLYLHDVVHGKTAKKLLHPVRDLYKQAGLVRDAQVSAQLVRKHKGIQLDFFTEQRKTVAREAKKLVREMNIHADDLILTNLKIWRRFRDIRTHDVRKMIKRLRKEIDRHFLPKMNLPELHETRKMIKRLVYIYGMLPSSMASRINLAHDEYKKLEQLIGNWHDSGFTIGLIEEYAPHTDGSVRLLRNKQKKLLGAIRKQFKRTKNAKRNV